MSTFTIETMTNNQLNTKENRMNTSTTLSNGLKITSVLTEAGICEMIQDNEKKDLAIFILDDTDFDQEQGTESLIYHVFIAEDFMDGEDENYKSFSRVCYSLDTAWDHAQSLKKKFPKFEFVGQV